MLRYYIIHKPYKVTSRFTSTPDQPGLNEYFKVPKDVYAVGRLDQDSEGLLLLTNDKRINNLLLNPDHQHEREYLVQVDGDITEEACSTIEKGVVITVNGKSYHTKPCRVRKCTQPDWVTERQPPVRFRKNIPTSWISITLTEGKNRQVRKMTAAAGFPTLRLIRVRIGRLTLGHLEPGAIRELNARDCYAAIEQVEKKQRKRS